MTDSQTVGTTSPIEKVSLKVDNLAVAQGRRRVIEGLTFSFASGTLAVLGPNGAGKSTLLSVLATLHAPDAGQVQWGGQENTKGSINLARRTTGYQEQLPLYRGTFTVREVVSYAAWLKKLPTDQTSAAVESALARVNLAGISGQRASRLSGGQTKRLAIAQALVHAPKTIILDEPTASLDPLERDELLEQLDRIRHSTNVIFSTHLTTDVDKLADRVLVLDGGRAAFFGPTDEFRALAAGADDPIATAYKTVVSRKE